VLNFILAGSETTANMFTLYLLTVFRHPEVEVRIREEIKEFIKSSEDFTFDVLKKMKYMDWVQTEAIRLYTGG